MKRSKTNHRRHRAVLIAKLLGLWLVLLWRSAAAQDEPPQPEAAVAPAVQTEQTGQTAPPEPAEQPEKPGNLAQRSQASIDETSARIEDMLSRSSLWMDSLFARPQQPQQAPAKRPYGSIELSDNWSQFYGNRPRVRFDARLDLPNTQHRLSGFIGRSNDEDFVRDRADNATLRARFPRVDTQDQWLAGLGYSLPSSETWWADFRVGARRVIGTEAFVQGRVHYNAYADARNLVHLRATPFWTTREGFGFTAGADYSFVFDEQLLLRWSNVGTVSEHRQDLDWRSTWTLYQAVGGYSGFAYELFARGETGDDVPLHEYGVQTTFRHPMLARRLYGEWVVGYSYPRENIGDRRAGSVQLGAGVEMPFGKRN